MEESLGKVIAIALILAAVSSTAFFPAYGGVSAIAVTIALSVLSQR